MAEEMCIRDRTYTEARRRAEDIAETLVSNAVAVDSDMYLSLIHISPRHAGGAAAPCVAAGV